VSLDYEVSGLVDYVTEVSYIGTCSVESFVMEDSLNVSEASSEGTTRGFKVTQRGIRRCHQISSFGLRIERAGLIVDMRSSGRIASDSGFWRFARRVLILSGLWAAVPRAFEPLRDGRP